MFRADSKVSFEVLQQRENKKISLCEKTADHALTSEVIVNLIHTLYQFFSFITASVSEINKIEIIFLNFLLFKNF